MVYTCSTIHNVAIYRHWYIKPIHDMLFEHAHCHASEAINISRKFTILSCLHLHMYNAAVHVICQYTVCKLICLLRHYYFVNVKLFSAFQLPDILLYLLWLFLSTYTHQLNGIFLKQSEYYWMA